MWWTAAFAADPTPAWGHASATPVSAGDAEVAAELTVLWWGPYVAVDVFGAPADRFALRGRAAIVSCPKCGGPGQRLTATAAYDLTGGDGFNVAPTLGFTLGTPLVATAPDFCWGDCLSEEPPFEVVALPGLAIEGGSRRVRGDLSVAVPLWAVIPRDAVRSELLATWGGEAGVTFLVGAERAHAVRVGMNGPMPTAGWRYERDAWFVEAALPFLFGVRSQVGKRF